MDQFGGGGGDSGDGQIATDMSGDIDVSDMGVPNVDNDGGSEDMGPSADLPDSLAPATDVEGGGEQEFSVEDSTSATETAPPEGQMQDGSPETSASEDERESATPENTGTELPLNERGETYPEVIDPRTGEPMSFPEEELEVMPSEERVPWGKPERDAFIEEWEMRGYPTPEGGWSEYDIHHIRPREYGGTNDFWNLAPVPRDTHQTQINPWWSGFKPK